MGHYDVIGKEVLELTAKQRDALNLLIQHKTSKEISRILGISPHTVDQRIEAAKRKFGVDTRGELAQAYHSFLATCQQLTHEESHIAEPAAYPETSVSEPPFLQLALSDPERSGLEVPTAKTTGYKVVHELFYGPMGTAYRLAAIVAIAMIMVITVLGGVSIFVTLTEILK